MQKVTLGDVAAESKETCKKDQSDYPTVGLEHLTPGELSLSRWDENSDTTFTKLFRKGDMLFGRRRAYLKKAAVAPFDGICSGDITVIRALPDKMVPELLPFIIQSEDFFDFAVGHSAGSLSPRVKWEHLKNYRFTLPPLAKQRELAEVLWAIEDTRTAYQRLEQATEELVKSRFIEMFGDPIINHHGWKKDFLRNHADVIVGYPFSSSEYVANGIPIVGGYNLMQGFVQWENSKYWQSAEGYEQYLLKDNDIVIAMDRPWVGSGFKIAPIKKDNLPAILIQRTACIRSNDVSPPFLYMLLDSIWFANHCQITGSVVPHISNKDILSYEIIVPPIALQNQFADFVAKADKSKLALQFMLEKIAAMKAAVIQKVE